MQKVEWAMMIVNSPRPAGQPKISSMPTNSSSRLRPVMTSGITRGAETMAPSRVLPRERRERVFAERRNEVQLRAGDDAGERLRQRHGEEGAERLGPEVRRRLEQRLI